MICLNDKSTKLTINKLVVEYPNDYIKAGNPNTSESQLAQLAKSTDVKVRRRVAENPNASPRVLFELIYDDAAEVREGIVDNPNTPEQLIAYLIKDEAAEIRFALAEDHSLSLPFLIQLCLDYNPYVANRAQLTVSRLQSNKMNLVAA